MQSINLSDPVWIADPETANQRSVNIVSTNQERVFQFWIKTYERSKKAFSVSPQTAVAMARMNVAVPMIA